MTENNQFNQDPAEESFDFRKWAGKILGNWYWFVLSVALFGAAAFFYSRYSVPRYHVSASLLVQQDKNSAGSIQLFQDMDMFGNQKNIQNEIGMLQSWSLARRALKELNMETSYYVVGRWTERPLYDNLPFRVTTGPNAPNITGLKIGVTILSDSEFLLEIGEDQGGHNYNINLKHPFNVPYQSEDFNFIISLNPNFEQTALPTFLRTNTFYFVINDLDRLAYYYQASLGVSLTDRMSSMLRLSIEGSNGQRITDYLNTLMDEYIQSSLEQKNQAAANTIRFIDDKIMGLTDTLKQAEQALQDFRSNNQVVNISAEGAAIINEYSRLEQDKGLIDLQVQWCETLLEYLKSDGDISKMQAPSTGGINDQVLTALIAESIQLSNEKSSYEYSVKGNNSALEKVNLAIKRNQENLSESVKQILKSAKLKQADVNSRISRLDRQKMKLPATERQLANFTRSFELQNSIYTFLLQRQAEAGITLASNVPDQMIIDEARVDAVRRVAPRNLVNLAIGLLIGAFLPLLVLILKNFLSFTIEEKADIEKRTDVPIIGTVGHNRHEDLIPVINHTRSSVTESFRAIRTNLQFSLYGEGKDVIMVTSSISGEGKSFLAMNLAGIYSVTGKKAVVVGLDLRKPMVQKYFDIPNKEGVSTYLIGKSRLSQIVVNTEYPNLSIIPSGPIPPNPAELLELPKFAEFIAELRAKFDIVILDTPPVALVTDAMLISKYADATMYVVRQKYTHKSALGFIDDLKKREHVKNLSIVINDVVVPKYYGYKYGYGYGYGYGKGYGSGYYTDDK